MSYIWDHSMDLFVFLKRALFCPGQPRGLCTGCGLVLQLRHVASSVTVLLSYPDEECIF